MNTTEKKIDREIVKSLLEDLRDLPDGTRITMEELLADSLYSEHEFDDEAKACLRSGLYSSARQEKIILDEPDDSSFIVHNGDAKYICPYCGSKNTAHIMFGLPDFTPALVRRLDEGRLRLGGCVPSFALGDRYCNQCGKEFFTSSSGKLVRKNGTEENRPEPKPEFMKPENIERAESLSFTFSVINRMTVVYQISHTPDAAIAVRRRGPYLSPENGETEERVISETAWYDLIHLLYDDFKFHEWDPELINDSIPDGIEWEVAVHFPGSKIQLRRGRNTHPSCWSDLVDRILHFFRDAEE